MSWVALLANPPRFHACSTGWVSPSALVARAVSTCRPGVAVHSYDVRVQRGVGPRPPGVGADLDAGDRRPAGPRPPLQSHGAGPHDAGTRHEVGKARGHEQRAGSDAGDRLAGIVGVLAQPVRDRLLEAAERFGDQVYADQPLDVGHAVPAGHHQADRVAVLRRQRCAVHGIGQQHVGTEGLGHRQAALVVLLDTALDAVVGAGEDHLDGGRVGTRDGEDFAERDASPFGGTHGFDQPRLADRARAQPGPAVAGAFQGDPHGARRHRLERVQVEIQRVGDEAAHAQPPGHRVQRRDVVVDEQVVQARRGQLVAQRLQWHAMVAGRQAQLVGADVLVGIGQPARGAEVVEHGSSSFGPLPVFRGARCRR